MTLGFLTLANLHVSPGIVQICISTAFIAFGFAVGSSQLHGSFAKLTGTQYGDLGVRMSWFYCSLPIMMLAAPLIAIALIDKESVNELAHTGSTLLLVTTILSVA